MLVMKINKNTNKAIENANYLRDNLKNIIK